MSNDFSQYYKDSDNVDEDLKGRNDVKGRPFWTPPVGTSRVRIMPAPVDKTDDRFYTWVPLHSYLPGSSQPVLCPAKHADMPCPACQVSNEYRRNGTEAMAMKFAPSWRGLVNVLVLDKLGKCTPDTRPLWWGISKKTLDNLLGKIEERSANGEDMRIASPRYGRDIFVRRTGTGAKDTQYETQPAEQARPYDKQMAEFLAKMNSLEIESCYTLLPADRIKGLLRAAPASSGWDATSEPIQDIWAPDDAMDGVFTELPQIAAPSDDPFAEPPEDEIEDPFATVVTPGDDDDDLPWEPEDAPAVAAPTGKQPAAASKVAEARNKLQASIAAKSA